MRPKGFEPRSWPQLGSFALGELVERSFAEARARYGGTAWSPIVVKLLEDALATPLRAPGSRKL